MIALKKLYSDELLKLALVLSLLRVDPSQYLETETRLLAGAHISNGSEWSIEHDSRVLTRHYIHPKSLDHILVNYERELFEELNSLGRYNIDSIYRNTFLINNVETETLPVSEEIASDDVVSDANVAHEVKIENVEEEDIFDDIDNQTFDVDDFFVETSKAASKDTQDNSDDSLNDDVFWEKSSKFDTSIIEQNLADLHQYGDDIYKFNKEFELTDTRPKEEDLEKFLIENTPLEADFDLSELFDEVYVKKERASTSFTGSSSGVSEGDGSIADSSVDVKVENVGDELTEEDINLIQVLWKQDVDMGFCMDYPLGEDENHSLLLDTEKEISEKDYGFDKLADLSEAKKADDLEELEKIEKVKASLMNEEEDPWAGLSYVVDTETGEYVYKSSRPEELDSSEESRFDLLEEALHLSELSDKDGGHEEVEEPTDPEMLHPAMARHPMPPHHPLAHYHNQSLMRSMSVEQRWQDLASLLTIPPPPEQYHQYHQQHPHNIGPHGPHGAAAGYAPNYGHIPTSIPDKHPEHYGASAPIDGTYKVEAAHHHHHQQHDGLYYQQSGPSEMGPSTSDGFLQSILNDEDLQLMDMAMNEGMYTMRILDGGQVPGHPPPLHPNPTHVMMTERDSASDSAVSSMGSERVPSLSDGEWCDNGSDSAQEYHSSKFRPYDSQYGRERSQPPQKKHQMFGKQRCFQDQQPPTLEPLANAPRAHSVIKYECTEQNNYTHENLHNMQTAAADYASRQHLNAHMPIQQPIDLNSAHASHTLLQSTLPSPLDSRYYATPERIRHNHTYASIHAEMRPAVRDKRVRRLTDGSMSDGGGSTSSGHLSRDEKRAKALGIPMEVQDIINLPMDEFNERLSKHDLSEAQLSLIRDIRRRGKNKVAAQNCRKRKLDQITSLADEVRLVRDRKIRTQRDHNSLLNERQRVKERFTQLYRHVFQNLRDAEGRPLSSSQYSLQQAADGNVVLVPRMQHRGDPQSMNRTSDDESERKHKPFEH